MDVTSMKFTVTYNGSISEIWHFFGCVDVFNLFYPSKKSDNSKKYNKQLKYKLYIHGAF